MYIEDYLNDADFKVINQKYMIAGQGMDIPLLPLRIKFAKERRAGSGQYSRPCVR